MLEKLLNNSAAQMPAHAALFIVSTPIGNLADITLRAVQVLRDCDLILCEDTRHSRPLLEAYGAAAPVRALHEHNEAESGSFVLAQLASGARVALISDAGTPLISDPGSGLVKAVAEAGYPIVPVPGASALLAATVAAGVSGTFTFVGFLPRKGSERQKAISEISAAAHVSVVYEAANRLVNTLENLAAAWGDEDQRSLVVCRELTKRYEEVKRGTVTELVEYYRTRDPRGEVVIVIDGRAAQSQDESELRDVAERGRSDGMEARAIMQMLIDRYGVPRNLAYKLAHTD